MRRSTRRSSNIKPLCRVDLCCRLDGDLCWSTSTWARLLSNRRHVGTSRDLAAAGMVSDLLDGCQSGRVSWHREQRPRRASPCINNAGRSVAAIAAVRVTPTDRSPVRSPDRSRVSAQKRPGLACATARRFRALRPRSRASRPGPVPRAARHREAPIPDRVARCAW